jgi:hypothetical protein
MMTMKGNRRRGRKEEETGDYKRKKNLKTLMMAMMKGRRA